MRLLPTLRLAVLIVTGQLLAGCAPEVGSVAWCEAFTEKPKQEWTADEVQTYLKTCVFGEAPVADP